eukprot:jgi/Chrzof1/10243/Cz04g34010.t1
MAMQCTMPRPSCRFTATRAATARPRLSTVRVACSSGVPANVADARAWIAAWRASQQQGSPAPKAAQAEAPKPVTKDAPKSTAKTAAPADPSSSNGKFAPCKSFPDGTLLFSAESLGSVKYQDVNLKKDK